MRRQRRDVAAALAQRRQQDVDDVQAIEQILAEATLGDLLLQVAVGRGDQADVGRDGLIATHAFELAFLQHAQELHLGRRRDVADFVEEQRAAVGLLEATLASAIRAGVRAALVAEQLALEQRLGEGGTVQPDERPVLWRGERW